MIFLVALVTSLTSPDVFGLWVRFETVTLMAALKDRTARGAPVMMLLLLGGHKRSWKHARNKCLQGPPVVAGVNLLPVAAGLWQVPRKEFPLQVETCGAAVVDPPAAPRTRWRGIVARG